MTSLHDLVAGILTSDANGCRFNVLVVSRQHFESKWIATVSGAYLHQPTPHKKRSFDKWLGLLYLDFLK